MESRDRATYIWPTDIFLKVQRQFNEELIAFPINGLGKTGYPYTKKMNHVQLLRYFIQNNSKWIIELIIKSKTINV